MRMLHVSAEHEGHERQPASHAVSYASSCIQRPSWRLQASLGLKQPAVQLHSKDLGRVVDIVVSHQARPLKERLVGALLSALVLPAPEAYRPLLRRLAALGALSSLGRA